MMKKHFRNLVSGILALLLLIGTTACGTPPTADSVDTTAAPVDTTVAVEETTAAPETTKYLDELPTDIDLQQTTIRIASRANERYASEFLVEEQNGETINDALFIRNAKVEERLNCVIKTDLIKGHNLHGPVRDGIENQLLSGTCEYDVIVGSMYMSMVHASNGYYLDLTEYSDIIDIEKPYWSTKFIEQAMVNNKLYTLTGDLALSNRQSTFMTVFNKEMVASYQMENPYTLVREGKWTIDKLMEMIANIYQDLNNNNIQDNEDMYGYTVSNHIGMDHWVNALNLRFVTHDATDGSLRLEVDKERFYTAYEKVYKLCFENGSTLLNPHLAGDAEMEAINDGFAERKYIFATSWLRGLEQQSIRNMEDPFGVLPSPKYDEAQLEYYSFTHDQLSVLSIPFTVPEERAETAVAPFLEAMASESHTTLIPQYYEVALKVKLVDAPDDAEMLDIITEGIYVDFAWMCQDGTAQVQWLFHEGIMKGMRNIASAFTGKMKIAEKSLSKFTAKFE